MIKNKNAKKKKKNTNAKFICSLTICFNENKKVTTLGVIKGNISENLLGTKGFGYDPIFIPKGSKKTFGQMSNKKKILMDHRFIAFQKLKRKINIL